MASFCKERVNFIRASNFLVDGGREALKEVFDGFHPLVNLKADLYANIGTFNYLRSKNILKTDQWDLLFPASGIVTSKYYDITLLFLLLRNICGLAPPATGWDNDPLPSDLSQAADIVRIKNFRNWLGHNADRMLSDSDFEAKWLEMKDVLKRLWGWASKTSIEQKQFEAWIDHLKISAVDGDYERNMLILLQSWEEDENWNRIRLNQIHDNQKMMEDKLMCEMSKLNELFKFDSGDSVRLQPWDERGFQQRDEIEKKFQKLQTKSDDLQQVEDGDEGLDYEDGTQVPSEIKARGIMAERAYHRALKQGKVAVNRGRIMLVGQDRAGKTSLRKSLLGLPFDPKEESTVGVEVDPSCCSIDVDNVKNWQRMTECTQTDFAHNIARLMADTLNNSEDEIEKEVQYKKKIAGYINHINMQPTNQDDASNSIEESQIFVNTEDNISALTHSEATAVHANLTEPKEKDPVPEDGNLTEPKEKDPVPEYVNLTEPKEKDPVPEDVTEKLVHYLQGLNLDEGSPTKPQTIVSIWDFAGQHLYYASHPVFLSPRALYLLVHNLRKDLFAEAEPCVRQGAFDISLENTDQQTNLEAILSWLASIHSMRPVSDEESEVESSDSRKGPGITPYLRPPVIVVGTNADRPFQDPKKMEIFIKKSLSGKSFQQHVIKPFFTVNNTLSLEDKGIQSLQAKIMEVLEMEPYMGEHIPVRWLIFEKVIKELVEEKERYILLPNLEKIVEKVCFINESDEIHAMLDYYHDLGIIIKHGDTVVLDSQWLINLFRKLITVRPYDDQNPIYGKYWNDLEERGILNMELVEHVFSSELLDNGQSKEDLLSMMERYGLIASFKRNDIIRYFVPAQLQSCPKELLDIQPSEFGPCSLYVHFIDGFVPHGLYSFFVSKLIA